MLLSVCNRSRSSLSLTCDNRRCRENRPSRTQAANGLSVALGLLPSGRMGYVVLRPGQNAIDLDPGAVLDTAAVDKLCLQVPLSILIAAGTTGFRIPDIERRIRDAYSIARIPLRSTRRTIADRLLFALRSM